MKHIVNYYLRGLEQRNAFAFFELAGEWMRRIDDERFKPVLLAYRQAIESYRRTLEPPPFSRLTALIEFEDNTRLEVWAKVKEVVDTFLSGSDEKHKAAFRRVETILADCGNPTLLPGAERTEMLDKLVEALNKKFTPDELNEMDLFDLLTELRRSNGSYAESEKVRQWELAYMVITRSTANSRKDVEKAYHQVTAFVNAMHTYLEDKVSGDVIDGINQLIEESKTWDSPPQAPAPDQQLNLFE